jgi:tetratricopeptide (TPR) repeat protein
MRGDFEEARQLVKSARGITVDLGLLTQAADAISTAIIEQLRGELDGAEVALRDAYRKAEDMGGVGPQANVAGMLARVLLLRGRIEEAEDMTRACERIAPDHQIDAQIKWRAIRAVILARRGDLEQAEDLAGQAIDLADDSDQVDSRAEAHVDLAEVLRLSGRHGEAARELELAVWLYKEKGNEVAERNARKLLGSILR